MAKDPNDEFPYDGYPRGWYQVGWAKALQPGDVKPLRYFGRDLVLYRSEDGAANVLDAICPHLGAHLGHGGTVEGDCIRCPFHGWKFDGEGHNTDIFYSDTTMKGSLLKSWDVHEFEDFIFVWYDQDGLEPLWDPPHIPEFEDQDTWYESYPKLTRMWENLRAKVSYIPENTVDFPHQEEVHLAPSASTLVEFGPSDPDHVFKARQRFMAGSGHEKTWLTPDGPVEAELNAEVHGLGVVVVRYLLTDNSLHVHCQTPIDEDHIDEFLTVLAERGDNSPDAPDELALRRFKFQQYQFERDVEIWKTLQYKQKPVYAPEEAGGFRSFRKWMGQFYEPASAVPVSV